MKERNNVYRVARLRRYHFRDGVIRRRTLALPSFLAGLLVIAGFGLSQVDFQKLLAEKPHNNVAGAVKKETEVSALEQSILRANQLDKQDKSLAETIKNQLDNYPDEQEWSVYVNDLSSGTTAGVNADKIYDGGSLHKLFLLAPLESKIPASQWEYNWDSGYNVSYCVWQFLGAADDSCSQQLGGYANWDYVNEYNQKIGFINTDMGDGESSSTNAREVGQLLTQLKTSQLLSDLGRRHVFDALYHQDYIGGLPSTCDDCAVANKSTETGEFVHDAGIVTRGDDSYVVVVMSKGGSLKQIGQITRAIDKELNP
jgi:hypothetical protein